MPSLQDREKMATAEFDARVIARRNKLLGIWAAERMGLIGESAAVYALGLVRGDFDGDHAIAERVCRDLTARGYPISPADIERELATLGVEAQVELSHGATFRR